MSWRNPSSYRSNNFDFLRLLLAVFVVFSHSFPLTATAEPLAHYSGGELSFGFVAVNGFFLISGFLITMSWIRSKSLLSFLKKRIWRIYPAFLVANVFLAFVVAPIGGGEVNRPWLRVGELLKATAWLMPYNCANAFAHNPTPLVLDGSMWTVPYEFRCYLLIAVLGLCGMFFRKWLALGAAVLLTVYVWCIAPHVAITPRMQAWFGDLLWLSSGWTRFITYFLIGMAFYLFHDMIPFSRTLAAVAAIVLAACFFKTKYFAFVTPVCMTYLVFWFGFEPRIKLQEFGKFGDFSYGAYLYAYPIQQMLVKAFPKINGYELTCVAVPLTLVAGILSWYGVERWFLRSRHGKRVTLPVVESAATPADLVRHAVA